ncbi:MAG: polynucleotide adenylyltransferase [Firmicutes bacterium]|nr:polynucleotide adenylyltransferase [Bacillota bacterium]
MYKEALNLLKIINNKYEAYIIGGYSRDLYMGNVNKDIDITTSATKEQLKELFKEYEIIDRGFGSVILIYNDYQFEITTYRKEYEYDKNRFPKKIEFIKELSEDLKRRDFVINTLCINEFGEYVDLLNARGDIDNKIIRCVGNSDIKISEDILRSLRAIRFATILNFKLDEELKNSIKKYNYLINNLSKKRKEEELNKILNNDNKEYGISLLKELEIDKYL